MGTFNSPGRGFLVALVVASMAIAASPAQAARREAIDNSGWKRRKSQIGSQHCRANRQRTLACTQATSRRTRRQAEDSSTTSWRLRRSPRRSRSCSDSAEGPDVVPLRAYGFGEHERHAAHEKHEIRGSRCAREAREEGVGGGA